MLTPSNPGTCLDSVLRTRNTTPSKISSFVDDLRNKATSAAAEAAGAANVVNVPIAGVAGVLGAIALL